MSQDFALQLRALVLSHIRAGHIAGAVTLVHRDSASEILDVQGASDLDPRHQLRADSIFAVASMTKPVIATCVLLLASEGKLSVRDPISKYIPEFGRERMVRTLREGQRYLFEQLPSDLAAEMVEPEFDYEIAHRPITVHDLLSSTSGLQTMGIANPAIPPIEMDQTLGDWVARLGDVPLEFQPGARWHYSNATGFDVLGRVVEVVAGTALAEFARDRLFVPLGMTDTGFGVQPWMADRLVPLGPLASTPIARPHYHSGSAGLFSTAADYGRYAKMLLAEGVYDGTRIIPAEVVSAMRGNQIGELTLGGVRAAEYAQPHPARAHPGVRYGYGVAVVTASTDDPPLPVGSYGWDGIGTRRFWVIPELSTVVVMLMPGLGDCADPAHRAIEAMVTRASP